VCSAASAHAGRHALLLVARDLGVGQAIERWVASHLGAGPPVPGHCAVGRTRVAKGTSRRSWSSGPPWTRGRVERRDGRAERGWRQALLSVLVDESRCLRVVGAGAERPSFVALRWWRGCGPREFVGLLFWKCNRGPANGETAT
jgi:hypothetical protein